MKRPTNNSGWFQAASLIVVTVSVVALTLSLADPHGPHMNRASCLCLLAAAWATLIAAWYRGKSLLGRFGGVLFLTLTLVVFVIYTGMSAPSSDSGADGATPEPTLAQRHFHELWRATLQNDIPVVRRILREDGDPDYVDCRETTDFVDVDCGTESRPLEAAVSRGRLEIAALLLAHGASATEGDPSPLVNAAGSGDVPMMRLLLQHGAVINEDSRKSIALCEAVDNGKTEAVSFLLEQGANPNSDDNDVYGKESVLRSARHKNNVPIIRLLKHAGAKE